MTDPITEKVRKLLRLAKSTNAAEAESALAKAMEMAARHQIDVHALAEDAEVAKLVTRHFRCGGHRIAREWREAMSVARQFFNITTCILRGQGKVAFIGTETDVQIADYVTGFLVRACRMELDKFAAAEKKRSRRMTTNKRASFIHAFFGGIWLQLKQQRETQIQTLTGLELALKDAAQARDAHMAADIGPTKTVTALDIPRSTKAVLYAGYDAGLGTRINPALGTDAPLELDYTP
jgi:hypothetical protein